MRKMLLFHKLLASYAAIAFFTLTALVVSYAGLYSLNATARDIVTRDFVQINAINKLRESIRAQHSYSAKFLILKGGEFHHLYLQREEESREILQGLRDASDQHLDDIAAGYERFSRSASLIFRGTGDPAALKAATDQVTTVIDKSLAARQKRLDEKLEVAKQREKWTVRLTLLLSLTGVLLGVSVAALLLYHISTAMAKLKRATRRFAEGDFDFDPAIPPGDEIGALAADFTTMATRLKDLEQICLDASPLTRLPGNIAIERVLERKLEEGGPFAVCYADLDNFKPYNDRYGYIQASELIKKTGQIIHEAAAELSRDPFVGHVGGDDFVSVIAPEEVTPVCTAVIQRFDQMIPEFYHQDDLKKGGLEGPDRYGVHRSFPVMTISISVVICQKGSYDSAVSIAKTAAEMKDVLKGKAGSNYFVNRRALQR